MSAFVESLVTVHSLISGWMGLGENLSFIKYGCLSFKDCLKPQMNPTDLCSFCVSVASGAFPVWIHRYLPITIINQWFHNCCSCPCFGISTEIHVSAICPRI